MAIGQTGALTRGGFGDGEVVRIDFAEPLTDPIIHLSSTNNGGNEFSLRIVSVDANGFNFIIDEFEDHDGPHPATETINWIAIEEGVHTLPDGRVIEAGRTIADDDGEPVSLTGNFGTAPVVLTNVMSGARGDDVVDSDPSNVTTSGFDITLQEGARSDGINPGETVGWIAIEPGGDGTSGVALTADGLDSDFNTFDLGVDFTNGHVFGETQTLNEPGTGNVIIRGDTTGANGDVRLSFDEDGGDGETAHGPETVGIVAFETGLLFCFTPGTLIDTAFGPRPVEDLTPGTPIVTADGGLRMLRWTAQRRLTRSELYANPTLAPITIKAGALGDGLPARDMTVSPQHRMLLRGPRARLMFDADEVLAPAIGLLNGQTILRPELAPTTYLHLVFDRHEVIRANGAWTESLFAADLALADTAPAARAELLALFPDLATDRAGPHGTGPARRCLTRQEARAMVG